MGVTFGKLALSLDRLENGVCVCVCERASENLYACVGNEGAWGAPAV